MITDHSDGMGAIKDIIAGAPNIVADPVGKEFHEAFAKGGQEAANAAFRLTALFSQGKLPDAVNYQPSNPAYKRVWDEIVKAAEEFNEPHRFTTFIAYEWTSLVKGNNLHRNVIFRDGPERAGQVLPYTTTPPVGSSNPRDLWTWLENYEKTTGGSVLAIPHNGNLSNGMMFAMQDDFDGGKAFDRAYAETRQKWERLYEATQMKGDGEAPPMLSPTDEFANFETWDMGTLDLNQRSAIFGAMQRREVYATTGPRMRVRFFGGFDFIKDDEKRRDLAFKLDLPQEIPLKTQERAYTSPIWYMPGS